MRITVFGTGYVGLVTGTCLADAGHDVLCVDVDPAKVEALKQGQVPIHEPGLAPMVARNLREGRLNFTTDAEAGVAFGALQFIAVGTPRTRTAPPTCATCSPWPPPSAVTWTATNW